MDKTTISLIQYDGEGVDEFQFESLEEARKFRPGRENVWLNVHGLHDPEVMKEIGTRFGLHPLVQEDILNTQQRPTVEDYSDYTFLVARLFEYKADTACLISDQVSIVLGRNFVLSFQERPSGAFAQIRERLRAPSGVMRSHGCDYLAYALLDTLVDRYFVMLDHLSDLAEGLEDDPRGALERAAARFIRLAREKGQGPHLRMTAALSDGERLSAFRSWRSD